MNLFLKVLSHSLRGSNYFFKTYFQNKKTLELGCGSGEFLSLGKKNFYGIDTNTEAINQASSKLNIVNADATNLPFQNHSFQAIRANNIIEHLYPQEAYQLLQEAARVLKKNGHIILHTQMANTRSWETFSHARPYPPISIFNITSDALNKEDFPKISNLRATHIFYEGPYHSNRIIFGIVSAIANFTPFLKRDYTMVLQKL